ncbi:hypothetical protein OBA47_02115, partial [bacterium]|nr:hypothetical protein [bacterium]
CCAIFLDACKGYSQQIEIEEFNSSLLTYENGVISYDGEELYPDDYRGIGSEKFLFKQGKEVKFE